LTELGHEVELLGEGPDFLKRILEGPPPELVLNIAEGCGASRSREARVPAVLEMLGIPHSGSDPLTLAVTLDKECAKTLVRAAGVSVARGIVVHADEGGLADRLAALPMPVIVKPAYEGSSKGIGASSVAPDAGAALAESRRLLLDYDQPVLVEEFIDGDELTVGVVGNDPPRIVGVMRIMPRRPQGGPFVYSLDVKRDFENLVDYECPARLPPSGLGAVEAAALGAWKALGCRDVARFDFRFRGGIPYFLECNPLPGLSPRSGDLVIMARLAGIDYRQLVASIVDAAAQRAGLAAAIGA
jgi:D-alanine-D-alanine ligase